eukprot:scaffold1171_cov177-Amphora_coffeaeformis.AAC.27
MNHLTVRVLRSRACRAHYQQFLVHSNCHTSVASIQLRSYVNLIDLLQEVKQDEDYDVKYQERYNLWKERRGPPPKDVLLDAERNEVISPKIDPDFCIQGGDDGGLPPALQHAVDQHVYWACQHEYKIPRNRNLVRHHKLDSRESLKKSKKKSIRKDLIATPFVLIGAYQRLLKRAQQYPYGNDKSSDLAGHNIRAASIPFKWFQTVSRVLVVENGVNGSLFTGTKSAK